MLIARVIGSAVSTIKATKLNSLKLLIVQEATAGNELLDRPPLIAADAVGAGEGELVIIVTGSSARYTEQTESTPVDAAIVGIIDSLQVGGKTTFRKA